MIVGHTQAKISSWVKLVANRDQQGSHRQKCQQDSSNSQSGSAVWAIRNANRGQYCTITRTNGTRISTISWFSAGSLVTNTSRGPHSHQCQQGSSQSPGPAGVATAAHPAVYLA